MSERGANRRDPSPLQRWGQRWRGRSPSRRSPSSRSPSQRQRRARSHSAGLDIADSRITDLIQKCEATFQRMRSEERHREQPASQTPPNPRSPMTRGLGILRSFISSPPRQQAPSSPQPRKREPPPSFVDVCELLLSLVEFTDPTYLPHTLPNVIFALEQRPELVSMHASKVVHYLQTILPVLGQVQDPACSKHCEENAIRLFDLTAHMLVSIDSRGHAEATSAVVIRNLDRLSQRASWFAALSTRIAALTVETLLELVHALQRYAAERTEGMCQCLVRLADIDVFDPRRRACFDEIREKALNANDEHVKHEVMALLVDALVFEMRGVPDAAAFEVADRDPSTSLFRSLCDGYNATEEDQPTTEPEDPACRLGLPMEIAGSLHVFQEAAMEVRTKLALALLLGHHAVDSTPSTGDSSGRSSRQSSRQRGRGDEAYSTAPRVWGALHPSLLDENGWHGLHALYQSTRRTVPEIDVGMRQFLVVALHENAYLGAHDHFSNISLSEHYDIALASSMPTHPRWHSNLRTFIFGPGESRSRRVKLRGLASLMLSFPFMQHEIFNIAREFVLDLSVESSKEDVRYTLQFLSLTLHREVLADVSALLCGMQKQYHTWFLDLLKESYKDRPSTTYRSRLKEKLEVYPHFLLELQAHLLPEMIKFTPDDFTGSPAFDVLAALMDAVLDTLKEIPFITNEVPTIKWQPPPQPEKQERCPPVQEEVVDALCIVQRLFKLVSALSWTKKFAVYLQKWDTLGSAGPSVRDTDTDVETWMGDHLFAATPRSSRAMSMRAGSVSSIRTPVNELSSEEPSDSDHTGEKPSSGNTPGPASTWGLSFKRQLATTLSALQMHGTWDTPATSRSRGHSHLDDGIVSPSTDEQGEGVRSPQLAASASPSQHSPSSPPQQQQQEQHHHQQQQQRGTPPRKSSRSASTTASTSSSSPLLATPRGSSSDATSPGQRRIRSRGASRSYPGHAGPLLLLPYPHTRQHSTTPMRGSESHLFMSAPGSEDFHAVTALREKMRELVSGLVQSLRRRMPFFILKWVVAGLYKLMSCWRFSDLVNVALVDNIPVVIQCISRLGFCRAIYYYDVPLAKCESVLHDLFLFLGTVVNIKGPNPQLISRLCAMDLFDVHPHWTTATFMSLLRNFPAEMSKSINEVLEKFPYGERDPRRWLVKMELLLSVVAIPDILRIINENNKRGSRNRFDIDLIYKRLAEASFAKLPLPNDMQAEPGVGTSPKMRVAGYINALAMRVLTLYYLKLPLAQRKSKRPLIEREIDKQYHVALGRTQRAQDALMLKQRRSVLLDFIKRYANRTADRHGGRELLKMPFPLAPKRFFSRRMGSHMLCFSRREMLVIVRVNPAGFGLFEVFTPTLSEWFTVKLAPLLEAAKEWEMERKRRTLAQDQASQIGPLSGHRGRGAGNAAQLDSDRGRESAGNGTKGVTNSGVEVDDDPTPRASPDHDDLSPTATQTVLGSGPEQWGLVVPDTHTSAESARHRMGKGPLPHDLPMTLRPNKPVEDTLRWELDFLQRVATTGYKVEATMAQPLSKQLHEYVDVQRLALCDWFPRDGDTDEAEATSPVGSPRPRAQTTLVGTAQTTSSQRKKSGPEPPRAASVGSREGLMSLRHARLAAKAAAAAATGAASSGTKLNKRRGSASKADAKAVTALTSTDKPTTASATVSTVASTTAATAQDRNFSTNPITSPPAEVGDHRQHNDDDNDDDDGDDAADSEEASADEGSSSEEESEEKSKAAPAIEEPSLPLIDPEAEPFPRVDLNADTIRDAVWDAVRAVFGRTTMLLPNPSDLALGFESRSYFENVHDISVVFFPFLEDVVSASPGEEDDENEQLKGLAGFGRLKALQELQELQELENLEGLAEFDVFSRGQQENQGDQKGEEEDEEDEEKKRQEEMKEAFTPSRYKAFLQALGEYAHAEEPPTPDLYIWQAEVIQLNFRVHQTLVPPPMRRPRVDTPICILYCDDDWAGVPDVMRDVAIVIVVQPLSVDAYRVWVEVNKHEVMATVNPEKPTMVMNSAVANYIHQLALKFSLAYNAQRAGRHGEWELRWLSLQQVIANAPAVPVTPTPTTAGRFEFPNRA